MIMEVPAHFDGEHIVLEENVPIQIEQKLTVNILNDNISYDEELNERALAFANLKKFSKETSAFFGENFN